MLEAVFEEIPIKQQVFAEVEALVRPDCILATNTSALSVTAMGAELEHPERLVGMHFFNPVALMPLVELVGTAAATTSRSRPPPTSARRSASAPSPSATRPGSSSTGC